MILYRNGRWRGGRNDGILDGVGFRGAGEFVIGDRNLFLYF